MPIKLRLRRGRPYFKRYKVEVSVPMKLDKLIPSFKDNFIILLLTDRSNKESIILESLKESQQQFIIHVFHDASVLHQFLNKNAYIATKDSSPWIIFFDLDHFDEKHVKVLQFLKQDDRTKDIPLILFCSNPNERKKRTAYQNHAGGFISKSMELEDFKKRLFMTLDYWRAALTRHHHFKMT